MEKKREPAPPREYGWFFQRWLASPHGQHWLASERGQQWSEENRQRGLFENPRSPQHAVPRDASRQNI
jgi:hypothetical protein